MKFWIVYWTVSLFVSDPCPTNVERQKEIEKYGVAKTPYYGCLVIHGHYDTKHYQKTFESSTTAKEFTDGMPQEPEAWGTLKPSASFTVEESTYSVPDILPGPELRAL